MLIPDWRDTQTAAPQRSSSRRTCSGGLPSCGPCGQLFAVDHFPLSVSPPLLRLPDACKRLRVLLHGVPTVPGARAVTEWRCCRHALFVKPGLEVTWEFMPNGFCEKCARAPEIGLTPTLRLLVVPRCGDPPARVSQDSGNRQDFGSCLPSVLSRPPGAELSSTSRLSVTGDSVAANTESLRS